MVRADFWQLKFGLRLSSSLIFTLLRYPIHTLHAAHPLFPGRPKILIKLEELIPGVRSCVFHLSRPRSGSVI